MRVGRRRARYAACNVRHGKIAAIMVYYAWKVYFLICCATLTPKTLKSKKMKKASTTTNVAEEHWNAFTTPVIMLTTKRTIMNALSTAAKPSVKWNAWKVAAEEKNAKQQLFVAC